MSSSEGVATTTVPEGPDGCWRTPPAKPSFVTGCPSMVKVVPSSTTILSPATVSWAESESLPSSFRPCALVTAWSPEPVTVYSCPSAVSTYPVPSTPTAILGVSRPFRSGSAVRLKLAAPRVSVAHTRPSPWSAKSTSLPPCAVSTPATPASPRKVREATSTGCTVSELRTRTLPADWVTPKELLGGRSAPSMVWDSWLRCPTSRLVWLVTQTPPSFRSTSAAGTPR